MLLQGGLSVLKSKICSTPLYFAVWRAKRMLRSEISLDIHLVEHCDLGCKGCSHYSPIAPKQFLNPDELKKSLEKLKCRGRKVIGKFDSVNLVGGEPLLNRRIGDIVRIVRDTFGTNPIRIITNGLILSNRPEQLSADFWQACRECDVKIEITHYPVNVDLDAIETLCKENGVDFSLYKDRRGSASFMLMRLLPDRRGKLMNYYHCPSYKCWELKGDRIYSCPQSAYVEYVNNAFQTRYKHRRGDSLKVSSLSVLKMKLFRAFPKPFCRYCEFPRQSFEWAPTRRAKEEWLQI